MELKDIFPGTLVKHINYEGVFEVQTVDDYSMTIWCRKINSIDFELKEFKLQDLRQYKRRK